jgi:hypothetical protein
LDLTGQGKEMISEFKPGDNYIRDGRDLGVIVRSFTVKREFGIYIIIIYLCDYDSSEYLNIFRLSDAPGDLIGVAHKQRNGQYLVFMSDKFILFGIGGVKECENQDDALKQMIDFSEKELEGHFNSLQFT